MVIGRFTKYKNAYVIKMRRLCIKWDGAGTGEGCDRLTSSCTRSTCKSTGRDGKALLEHITEGNLNFYKKEILTEKARCTGATASNLILKGL